MSKKLLLADDSITIQKVVGITFATEDIELAVADNGADALDRALSDPPDLILADVHMPEVDGYELAAAVKKDQTLKHVPVLLLTGTFESFDEERARQVGADDWIAKPFESQALIKKVQQLLEKAAREPAVSESPAAKTEAALPETAEEDIWSDFTFEEDELAAVPAVGAASPQAAEEEDVLDLDEADIVEEELEEGAAEETPSLAAEEEPFSLTDSAPVEEPSPTTEESSPFAEPEPVSASFGVFGSADEGEAISREEEENSALTEADVDELAAHAGSPVAPAPSMAEEAPAPSAPVSAEVPGKGLSEEETARIVERVAAQVVERLAGTIVEKIAWEVVPDLAESMIRDEIRKIREALK